MDPMKLGDGALATAGALATSWLCGPLTVVRGRSGLTPLSTSGLCGPLTFARGRSGLTPLSTSWLCGPLTFVRGRSGGAPPQTPPKGRVPLESLLCSRERPDLRSVPFSRTEAVFWGEGQFLLPPPKKISQISQIRGSSSLSPFV